MRKRDIPEPIKRKIRQQCYFGCAICGSPVFDYHHIIDFSQVKKHSLENIVLLCRHHHGDVSTGKMSIERVIEAKNNPFNSSRSFTAEYRIEPNRFITVMAGSNSLSRSFPNGNGYDHGLWVNGQTFLGINSENGWLTISLILTDSQANQILVADKGELIIASDVWDYKYEGTRLTVFTGLREVILDLNLSNYNVAIHKGMFLDKNNDGFRIDNGELLVICSGRVLARNVGSQSRNNMFGGWGLLNSKIYPIENAPGGFGFFFSC
jgi:hypothetical protein